MRTRIFLKVFFALLPLLVIGVIYIVADPFLILRTYDFSNVNRPHLEVNEDYVSTENLVKTLDNNKYDSYVFGSSRTRYFTPEEWGKHIPSQKIFNYGVALESLYGETNKIKFLDKKGVKIKNAFVLLDEEILSRTANSKGHLYKKHPLISGEKNIDYQFTGFIDFFNVSAISLYFKSIGNSKGAVEDPQKAAERMIETNKDGYYKPREHLFYKREPVQQYEKPIIAEEQKKLLLEMKSVFSAHNTDYRIVVPPTYNQKKLAPEDMEILYAIFGKSHIYDFSGINEITNDKYNYFEEAHFRPAIAYRIMDSVYAH